MSVRFVSVLDASDNEIIIDMADWKQWQPQSIEAVWFLKDCPTWVGGSMLCEPYARQVHSKLKRTFGLSNDDLPLLSFDRRNWKQPFATSK